MKEKENFEVNKGLESCWETKIVKSEWGLKGGMEVQVGGLEDDGWYVQS